MTRICFVSYEIHPTVEGGCGVLLHNAARILLAQGHEVIFLLDLPDKEFSKFNEVDRLQLPNAKNCRAYQVWALTTDLKYSRHDFKSIFEFRSYRFHKAASKIEHLEKPDVIEFLDYTGTAYHALSAKVAGMNYKETHIAVRLHNSLELIDRQQPGNLHGIDRYLMYGLEHQALRLAETVLYPSKNFLENAYQPHYEKWFGKTVFSKPPLVDKPEPDGICSDPDIVLFYGRLIGFKGVDIFVDAAVLYLSNPQNPSRKFYLVGYDSSLPPGSTGRYQDYLRRKIPPQFQSFFYFTGQLSWEDLGKLLPQVLFAVIPSYFESFCYAAHELYEAGIPLIVSDIPSFQDYFKKEQNALVFDGSVSDLAMQMKRLSVEAELREKIRRPYSVNQNPLGKFYSFTHHSSWINSLDAVKLPDLLICILCDEPEQLENTISSLKPILSQKTQVVILRPVQDNEPDHIATWFLGKLYTTENELGEHIYPTQVYTKEALLILKSGDEIDPKYISTGLSVLQRQPQITYIGSWKRFRKQNWSQVNTLSLDTALELASVLQTTVLNRYIMKTVPGKLLVDLFDIRAGRYGELAYLWQLESDSSCGVIISDPYIVHSDEEQIDLNSAILDYLVIRDNYIWRKERLSRFHLTLANRNQKLRDHMYSEDEIPTMYMTVTKMVHLLRKSKANEWLNRVPWIKRVVKRLLQNIIDFFHRLGKKES